MHTLFGDSYLGFYHINLHTISSRFSFIFNTSFDLLTRFCKGVGGGGEEDPFLHIRRSCHNAAKLLLQQLIQISVPPGPKHSSICFANDLVY